MIQVRTKLEVADNSGARKLGCIRILGGSRKRYGTVGDIIVCSVKEVLPNSKVKKGEVVKAVIVRTKKEIRRIDGSYVRFDDNSAVIINQYNEPVGPGSSVRWRESCEPRRFMKIVSLAPEVV